MARITAIRNSVDTREWAKIFPEATDNYTNSVTFMKQLTTIALSTITYTKNIFPEENYLIEKFADVRFRILKNKCQDELAQFLSTALVQAFEAFDKKYLQKLVLCFYDGEYDIKNLKEYYMFEYLYTSSGVTMDVTSQRESIQQSKTYSLKNMRQQTIDLIKACIVVTDAKKRLPNEFEVIVRLYYNDNAPDGYQAPGFLSTTEAYDHLDSHLQDSCKIGSVSTPFHQLDLQVWTRTETPASQLVQQESNKAATEMICFGEADMEIDRDNDVRVQCECGLQDRNPDDAMLVCHYCGTLQHAVCYARRRRPRGAAPHVCVRCAAPRRACTDPHLFQLAPNKRESHCVVRRALAWCAERARVGVGEGVGVGALMDRFTLRKLHAFKLLRLLTQLKVLEDTDQDLMSPRNIVPSKLAEAMSHYFEATESDVTERLVAESLAPTGPAAPTAPTPDRLARALRPSEQVTLRQTTHLGKMIEPPQPDTAKEDALLKQYKEAIEAIRSKEPIDERLPLSGNHNPVQDMETIGKKTGKRKGAENKRPGIKNKRAKK